MQFLLQILAIEYDNAANINTILNKISTILYTQNIIFDLENQHIRCLIHIINLTVQKSLESLNVSGPDNENSLENNEETEIKLTNIIYKVSLYFYYFKSF